MTTGVLQYFESAQPDDLTSIESIDVIDVSPHVTAQ